MRSLDTIKINKFWFHNPVKFKPMLTLKHNRPSHWSINKPITANDTLGATCYRSETITRYQFTVKETILGDYYRSSNYYLGPLLSSTNGLNTRLRHNSLNTDHNRPDKMLAGRVWSLSKLIDTLIFSEIFFFAYVFITVALILSRQIQPCICAGQLCVFFARSHKQWYISHDVATRCFYFKKVP